MLFFFVFILFQSFYFFNYIYITGMLRFNNIKKKYLLLCRNLIKLKYIFDKTKNTQKRRKVEVQENVNGIQNTALKQFLAVGEIDFLNELQDKTYKINIELFDLENKKEMILEKNAEDCYNFENDKDEIKIRNDNYEIAMESLNSISRNLYNLYNNYNTISQLNNL